MKQSNEQDFEVPLSELDVRSVAIERALGYVEQAAPESITEMIDCLLAEAPTRTRVRCGYRLFDDEDVMILGRGFSVGGLQFDTGEMIAAPLHGSTRLVVFVGTAGEGLDAWSRELFQAGDLMTGYTVDAIGSEIAEQTAEWVLEHISDVAETFNMTTTNPYSPGHCDWNVEEQHKLFSLLPKKFCGVSLTDSALMVPVKSVSGVIGLGEDVARTAYGCSICTFENCFRRAVRATT